MISMYNTLKRGYTMDNDILYGATNQFNFPELPNSRIILSEKVLQKLI